MENNLASRLDRLDAVLLDMGRRLTDSKRLQAVDRLLATHGPVKPFLSHLTEEAAEQCRAPFSSCSIITATESVLIGACGGDAYLGGYPVEHSYCQYVAGQGRPFKVEDSLTNPLVRFQASTYDSVLPIRSYYGVPVFDPEGWPLGSFCVADSKAREWTPNEMAFVEECGEQVTDHFAVLLASS